MASLSEEQKARIAENRKRALELRAQRTAQQPQQPQHDSAEKAATTSLQSKRVQLVAGLPSSFTPGGFVEADNEDTDAVFPSLNGDNLASKRPKLEGAECRSAEAAEGPCEVCGRDSDSITLVRELAEGFGLKVCVSCREGNDDYSLLSKGDAQKQFLIPEGTIGVLRSLCSFSISQCASSTYKRAAFFFLTLCRFIEKSNPRQNSWTPMKLYLKREVGIP